LSGRQEGKRTGVASGAGGEAETWVPAFAGMHGIKTLNLVQEVER
jgi:hypothetical protein